MAGKLGTILIAACLAALTWVFWPAPEPAPQVRFNLSDGTVLDSASLRGKPVLVSFWSVSCAVCMREMPLLSRLQESERQHGLEIVAVAMPHDPPQAVMDIVAQRRPGYRIALDVHGEISKAFGGIEVTPTHILIDPAGNITQVTRGALDEFRLKAKLATFI